MDGRLRKRCCRFFDARLDVRFPIEMRNGRCRSGSVQAKSFRGAAEFLERQPASGHQCEQSWLLRWPSGGEFLVFTDRAVKVLLLFEIAAKFEPSSCWQF